ncbi:MAG: hypothetical protein RM049_15225 [Nostoc sp. DedQUE04]|uniref:hypothetical protein n=1 Tax=Nostoc sp. DedQUE04 TaxID=3075390 RepID=UPI002AD31626|nr:hypothetical protein [Nostoc sp. DedQUE04]MDZ8136639.1 hypothetical protein [Nostoc sp. DedQUE04]
MFRYELNLGHWALGIGHWAWGIGHWALVLSGVEVLGIGHWAWGIEYLLLSIGKNEEQDLRKIMKNELHRCRAASCRVERTKIRVLESFCVSTKEYWLVPMPNAPVIKYANFLIRFFY